MIDTADEQQATNFRQRRMTYDLLCVRPLIGCVSQGKDDDEGVHPKHHKEPDVKNVGHWFPLKPTVNNHGGSVNWKLAREGMPGCYLFRIFSASPVCRRRLNVESLCPLWVIS